MSQKNKYKSIFVSDLHIGSRHFKAELFLDFLKHNSAENWFFLGDIIDLLKIKGKRSYFDKHHTTVIQKILKISKKANVHYILGNHDADLRQFVTNGLDIGRINICSRQEYTSVSNKKYLLIHGDFFDHITSVHTWLATLGDIAYDLILNINTHFNFIRNKLGFGYWSFSKFIKHKVKDAISYINDYEEQLTEYAKIKKFDGVICGHIHKAEIRDINGINYLNCGDFVESCTAIVETYSGEFQLIHWEKKDKILFDQTHLDLVEKLFDQNKPINLEQLTISKDQLNSIKKNHENSNSN